MTPPGGCPGSSAPAPCALPALGSLGGQEVSRCDARGRTGITYSSDLGLGQHIPDGQPGHGQHQGLLRGLPPGGRRKVYQESESGLAHHIPRGRHPHSRPLPVLSGLRQPCRPLGLLQLHLPGVAAVEEGVGVVVRPGGSEFTIGGACYSHHGPDPVAPPSWPRPPASATFLFSWAGFIITVVKREWQRVNVRGRVTLTSWTCPCSPALLSPPPGLGCILAPWAEVYYYRRQT